MKLFDLSFPNEKICTCSDLYYRSDVSVAKFSEEESCLQITDGAVSFDTFFNLFSCGKYIRHTVVNSVVLKLDVEGDVAVDLFHADGDVEEDCCWADGLYRKRGTSRPVPKETPEGAIKEKVISHFCDNATHRRTLELQFDVTTYSKGYVYFTVTANGAARVYGGCYETSQEPEHSVKVGLVICTYKREEYVKSNVRNISEYKAQDPDLVDSLQIFVIDNAHTLSEGDVIGATLIYNKNLGGSGGFTRGMMEVCAREDFTHVLLSDDDVVYQPQMFRKTLALLQYAKNPDKLAVGAAMLRSDRPNVQHEMGAHWNRDKINVVSLHGGYDLTKRAALLKNEDGEKAEYSGWWYLCMPASALREKGLSLPLFIKYDDVEHCARCGFEFAHLNGIGLWHEPFENKYSAYLDYYTLRNMLIADAVARKSGGFKCFKWVVTNVALQLVYQRYFAIKFFFAACNDFLKGADFLLSTDGEQLNKRLISENLQQQTAEQLQAQGFDLSTRYTPPYKATLAQVLTLNGYLIPTCFYKKQNRNYQVVDMRTCYPRQFYKVKRVVQFNPVTGTGFVTKQKFGQLFSAGFKLMGLAFKMLFCYRKAAKSYRKNYAKLTSFENWEKLLDSNNSQNQQD